jgi:hypothetical protein
LWWASDQYLLAMEGIAMSDHQLLVAQVWMLCSDCLSCHPTLFPDLQKALVISHSRRMRDPDCTRLVMVGPVV